MQTHEADIKTPLGRFEALLLLYKTGLYLQDVVRGQIVMTELVVRKEKEKEKGKAKQ